MERGNWNPPDPLAEIAHDPYLEVFGRFWDGMSFLIASSAGAADRLVGQSIPIHFTMVSAFESFERYMDDLPKGGGDWPPEFLLWQSFAFTVVEAHGLLDEYLRAVFELLTLAKAATGELDMSNGWVPEKSERARIVESRVRADSDRFAQTLLWDRIARLRRDFGLKIRMSRPLTAALKHQREIRNGVVHGQLTPHVVMPDGTIARMQAYPPPPYVPLGRHIIRGAMSVMLAAHQQVDTAIASRLGIGEDPEATIAMNREIERGRAEWFVDPWEPHEEHLFEAEVLRAWRPLG